MSKVPLIIEVVKPRRHSQHYTVLLFVSLAVLLWLHLGKVEKQKIPIRRRNYTDFHSDKVSVRTFTEPLIKCPQKFGKITFFIIYRQESLDKGYYGVALESLRCYLKRRDYELKMVDIDRDERVQTACGRHKQLFFKKHCAVAEYLKDAEWMLVLDADTGVVNPHHCVEEWIDDRVNLIFYERFFNKEVASANYLVRNSRYSHDFLTKWAAYEFGKRPDFNGLDNGALQLHLIKSLLPETNQTQECEDIWWSGRDAATFDEYIGCVQKALGPDRLWPGKVRIWPKAHGWVRDGFVTSDKWGPKDFMLHGWKIGTVGDHGWFSPFKTDLNAEKCGKGDSGWLWRPEKKVTDEKIYKLLSRFDRNYKNLALKSVSSQQIQREDCYPFCGMRADGFFKG